MSDKTYACPNCLASAQHKGKCDMCGTQLVCLDDLSEERFDEMIEKFKNNQQGENNEIDRR